MSINFPSTPVLNQQITVSGTTYSWDGTGWNIVPQMMPAVASDTPPANPAVGQMWWRASNGQLYIWYDDGTTRQWVQAAGAAGSPGAWERIEGGDLTTTLLSVNDLAPFEKLRIRLHAFLAADTICYMQLSSDNGATWLTAASTYYYNEQRWVGGANAWVNTPSNAWQLSSTSTVIGGSGGQGFAVQMELDTFNKSRATHIRYQSDFMRTSDSLAVSSDTGGYLGGIHNAFKIFPGSAAFSGGTYLVEGVRG